jgi:hypothetical protein
MTEKRLYTNGDIVVDEELMLVLSSDVLWEEVQKEIDNEIIEKIIGIGNKRYSLNGNNWDDCEHIWNAKIDSQFSSEHFTAVKCVKCQCPGEMNNKTGEVYWPAT